MHNLYDDPTYQTIIATLKEHLKALQVKYKDVEGMKIK
jgi:hypothetical protein